ncbi:MAG: hypothetical protein R6U98_06365 [Pirellulaceae bacterium]
MRRAQTLQFSQSFFDAVVEIAPTRGQLLNQQVSQHHHEQMTSGSRFLVPPEALPAFSSVLPPVFVGEARDPMCERADWAPLGTPVFCAELRVALAAEVPLELVQRVTGHKTVEAVPTPDEDTVAALDEITGIPKGVSDKPNQARVEKALELLKTVTASLTGEPEVARA